MTGPFADRLFRIAFALAGCYNLAFGVWAGFWPLAFFELFDLAPPRYAGIWACLGMVVGVYGLLYLHAAWRLETAWPIIAVGFLGKVLGPIGMLMSFSDDWPRRVGMLCIYNDLIWWLPFGLFLVRGTRFGSWLVRAAPWICIATHLLGILAAAAFLRHGTILEPDKVLRAAYVANHGTTWSFGWFVWMLSAMSFVGFCAWWGSYLCARQPIQGDASIDGFSGRATQYATMATVIAAFGTIFDFSGEGLLILLLVERAASVLTLERQSNPLWDATQFIAAERGFTLLSAGVANLLYTIAGIILTLVTPNLPKWVRMAMWISWLAGIGMTFGAIFDNVAGLVVSSAVLFPLMFVWITWMAVRWRGP